MRIEETATAGALEPVSGEGFSTPEHEPCISCLLERVPQALGTCLALVELLSPGGEGGDDVFVSF